MRFDQTEYQGEHQKVWGLLPWIVNGSADASQVRRVDRHQGECTDCCAELARERRLASALKLPPDHAPDVERGIQRLLRRLDHVESLRSSASAPRRMPARIAGMTLVGVGLVELVALAALLFAGARLLGPSVNGSPTAYRTLTEVNPREGVHVRLRLVFDSTRPVRELQAALLTQGLVVVDGPSETGVWSLGFEHEERDAETVARALRHMPGVLFAEPVGLPGS